MVDPTTGAVTGATGYGPSALEAQLAALDSIDAAAGGMLGKNTGETAGGASPPGGA